MNLDARGGSLLLGMEAEGFMPLDEGTGYTDSVVERVVKAIEAHEAAEEEAIVTYRSMAAGGDPAIALVMQLVVEDEERHHRLMEQVATRLNDDLRWTSTPGALPAATRGAVVTTSISLAEARRLADDERQGVTHLRRLAREIAALHDGLPALLLEMMALDSEKHERVLHYVEHRLAANERAAKRA